MVGCEIIHISPTQSAETTENEEVPNKLVTFILVFIVVQGFYNLAKKLKQEGGHHQMNLQ